jgi:hypothetical protein
MNIYFKSRLGYTSMALPWPSYRKYGLLTRQELPEDRNGFLCSVLRAGT